jgi:ABC-type multidrug transport system fused ATPase/permease subunit
MIDIQALKDAWSLLDRRERRNAWIVLAVMSVTAVATALMVGSIFPFLSVLADPSSIERVSQLNWLYETFGFTSSFSFLLTLGFTTLAVVILTNALQMVNSYVIIRYALMRSHALSQRLLGRYLNQPYEFFLNRHSGDMSTRVLAEVDQVVGNFFQPVAQIAAGLLTILAVIALLIWVNPSVVISAFLIFGALYGGLFLIVRKRLAILGTRRVKTNKQRYITAKEVLSGIKEVKLHGQEEAYLKRFTTASYITKRTAMVSELIGQLPRYIIQTVALSGIIVFCLLLLDRSQFEAGNPALGDLLPLVGVIAFAGQRLLPELSRIFQNAAKMKFGVAALKSLHEDLYASAAEPKASLRTASDSGPLGLRSDLELQNVSYRYPKAHKDSLNDASFSIRCGERIGIVGGTGAGKTTVADIILGLLAPTNGRVLVDGVEIDEANLRRWQRSVGYVPQEIFLVDATIAENIAFGVPAKHIDRDLVEEVARIAQLDRFVRQELPDGYDTAVGERGVRLSGGQKQRIGIARALYREADLIVFDEATSALDNLTERDVMAAIAAIPENKTVVTIAHRLSTVKACDRIAVLDKGHIVDVGSWTDLINRNPTFRRLADAA